MSNNKVGDKGSGWKPMAEGSAATFGDNLSADQHKILQELKRQLLPKSDGATAEFLQNIEKPIVQTSSGEADAAQKSNSGHRKFGRSNPKSYRKSRAIKRQERSVDHGNLSVYHDKRSTRPPVPELIAKLVLPSSFLPNQALIKGPESNPTLLRLTHDGIADSNSNSASEDVELVLGVDFGTSCIKIVIGDNAAKQRYLVEFNDSVDERFFLRSRIFECDGKFSLDNGRGSGSSEIRDIKLNLIRKNSKPNDQNFDHACGLLALAIRRARAWFFDRHLDDYRDARLIWSLNVGLPASSYEDTDLTERIRKVSWAAANLAADPAHREITRVNVENYRAQSHLVYGGASPSGPHHVFHADLVNVVPEIAAEVFGFVNSARFDLQRTSCITMYDVGAGTADTALVGITSDKRSGRTFSFYGSDVQPLGVINLHKARVRWLQAQLSNQLSPDLPSASAYLEAVDRSTYSLDIIPEKIEEYFPGSLVENDNANNFVDLQFRRSIQNHFLDCVYASMGKHGVGGAKSGEVPFFLCGGGSRHPVYNQIATIFNKNQKRVRLRVERLPFPEDLVAQGLAKDDFDRVAVAYGLSGESVAKIIREKQIPSFQSAPQEERDRYFVSKDQV